MEIIKFKLKGKFAAIRKPESNVIYYTYNMPHKITVMGIIGAIIGLNGYNYNALIGNTNKLPEFYEKLENIKIGIKPNISDSNFVKKMQQYNNGVGYAGDKDNNLIVTEQWLEDPSWDIYIMENASEEYKKLKDYLLNKKCEYIPYLGKNDHFADISDCCIINAELKTDNILNINTIFTNKIAEVNVFENDMFNMISEREYEYKEVMPTKLNAYKGYDGFMEFVYTNKNLKIKNNQNIYEADGEIVYFF